jgi:diguanylate cyclase (GGDEF)-like protein
VDIGPYVRTLTLAVISMGAAHAQTLPGWRFWDSSDGMAETYTSAIIETDRGTWLKHGHTPMDLLNGYQFVDSTHPHAIGQPGGAPDGTLWLWSGTLLRRFSSGAWASFPVPEVTNAGTLREDDAQNWRYFSKSKPQVSARLGLAPLSVDRILILLPDRILEFDAHRHKAVPVLLAGQTRLGSFLSIYRRSSGGVWISGRIGLGWLAADRDGVWRWSEAPHPPSRFSDFSELIEANTGDVFVTSAGVQSNTVLRCSNGVWSKVYSSQSSLLRGWSDNEGVVWIQDGNRILQLAEGRAQAVEKIGVFAGIPLSVRLGKDAFWVTTSQGAARHAPSLWRAPAGLEPLDEVVSAITQDSDGRLWFASASALISYDNRTWKRYSLPRGHQTWPVYTDSLAVLPGGVIAMRTPATRLLTFDPRTQQWGTVRHPEGREIGLFVKHPKGLLVQTYDEGSRSRFRIEIFNGHSFRTVVANGSKDPDDELRHMHVDRSGNVWAGCVTSFGVYHGEKFERQGPAQGYTDNGCFLIFEARSGRLYAGGTESLLVREGGPWRAILHGLDRTRSIMEARDGTLWVASGNGIYRYRNGIWISHGADEGLPSTVAYRVFEDSSGRIWAGTTRGIALYHPETDRDPPLTILSVEQNPHEFGPDGQARLVFSGVDKWKQTPADRLLFSWRLDGGPWSGFSTAQSAGFKHLAAGARRFEVRAMDRNGNIDPHPASLSFVVLPPWYRNSTFQAVAAFSLVCIFSLLALAALSYRNRGALISELHRKKRLESDRQTILEMVARRKPLPMILQRIARSISVNCPGTMAGVIRVREGRVEVAADPRFLEQFRDSLSRIPADRAFAEIWSELEAAAFACGMSGCRFMPIRSGDDELLGAIVVSLRPKIPKPAPLDMTIITGMSNLAGAAIDNARLYERLARQAGYDALTALPNRLTFESQLAESLLSARQNVRAVAVFFLDLDGFKQINDSLGHRIGDLLLKTVACRLSGAIPPGEMLARIGGDEFTLVLQQRADRAWAAQVAGRMLDALREPCVIEDHEVPVSASIGISLYPKDGDDPEALQKHADSAMYRAKMRGRNCYEFYSAEATLDDLRRLGSALTPPAPSDRSAPHS